LTSGILTLTGTWKRTRTEGHEKYLRQLLKNFDQNRDTIQLGRSTRTGNLRFELPSGTDQLLMSFSGMESTSIKVPAGCDYLEFERETSAHENKS
jgi:hypothetical protein